MTNEPADNHPAPLETPSGETDVSDALPTQQEIDSELLTAYLDGELSDSESIAVERRLATDNVFHEQMRELQSAWDMLDSLPLVRPNSTFVQTTVELAISPPTAKSSKNKLLGSILLASLFLVLFPVAMFGLGFWFTRESIEQPERELVYELPLIENYDRYSRVLAEDDPQQSIQFLDSIYERGLFAEVSGLFPTEASDVVLSDFESGSAPLSAERIRDRSDRVSKLSPQQREDLFRKKQKFESLPETERNSLRDFHELLSKHPQRKELVEVLISYYDWLKTLGATQRASLSDLSLENRLLEIKNITREQAEKAFGMVGSTKLPLDDAVWFYKWYDLAIRSRSKAIRDRTAEVWVDRRQREGQATPSPRDVDRIRSGPLEQLVEFLMRYDRDYFRRLISTTSETGGTEIEDLRRLISEDARQILDEQQPEKERPELVLKWIEAANQTRFPIKSSTLKTFYQSLPQEDRDDLDNLHPEQWHESLTRMYWDANIGKRSDPSQDQAFEKFLRDSGFEYEFGIEADADAS